MRTPTFVLLITMMLFLAACSTTQVVKPGETQPPAVQPTQPVNTTVPTNKTTSAPKPQPVITAADRAKIKQCVFGEQQNKTPVKCDDTDGQDTTTSGRVRVDYSDGTFCDFVDECPGNSNIVTEYYCQGNNAKSKLAICKNICVAGLCLE